MALSNFKSQTEEVNDHSRYNFSELTEMVDPLISEVEDRREAEEIKSENDYLDAEMVKLGLTGRCVVVFRVNGIWDFISGC